MALPTTTETALLRKDNTTPLLPGSSRNIPRSDATKKKKTKKISSSSATTTTKCGKENSKERKINERRRGRSRPRDKGPPEKRIPHLHQSKTNRSRPSTSEERVVSCRASRRVSNDTDKLGFSFSSHQNNKALRLHNDHEMKTEKPEEVFAKAVLAIRKQEEESRRARGRSLGKNRGRSPGGLRSGVSPGRTSTRSTSNGGKNKERRSSTRSPGKYCSRAISPGKYRGLSPGKYQPRLAEEIVRNMRSVSTERIALLLESPKARNGTGGKSKSSTIKDLLLGTQSEHSPKRGPRYASRRSTSRLLRNLDFGGSSHRRTKPPERTRSFEASMWYHHGESTEDQEEEFSRKPKKPSRSSSNEELGVRPATVPKTSSVEKKIGNKTRSSSREILDRRRRITSTEKALLMKPIGKSSSHHDGRKASSMDHRTSRTNTDPGGRKPSKVNGKVGFFEALSSHNDKVFTFV